MNRVPEEISERLGCRRREANGDAGPFHNAMNGMDLQPESKRKASGFTAETMLRAAENRKPTCPIAFFSPEKSL